jgi:hypothetical protein
LPPDYKFVIFAGTRACRTIARLMKILIVEDESKTGDYSSRG